MKQKKKCESHIFGPTTDPRYEKCYFCTTIKVIDKTNYYPEPKKPDTQQTSESYPQSQ